MDNKENREGYWAYMSRKLRELTEDNNQVDYLSGKTKKEPEDKLEKE